MAAMANYVNMYNIDHHPSGSKPNSLMRHQELGRSIVYNRYKCVKVISRGAYGVVHGAINTETGEIVAIKEELQGLSISTLREINILKSLPRHPSIVEFKDVIITNNGGKVYVVMEYLETDLNRYIHSNEGKSLINISKVKYLMRQLLGGVKFLHANGVIHRDLKPSNILMNKRGDQLKICDFGLSRHCGSSNMSGSYTPGVVTLWYRAPELLVGAKEYSSAIDMWSVGCIMAELLLKQVLFEGGSEIEQLCHIHRILLGGVRNNNNDNAAWSSRYNLLGQMFVANAASGLQAPLISALGFDLLTKLLAYDPSNRITAEDALHHAWFMEFDSYLYREFDSYAFP